MISFCWSLQIARWLQRSANTSGRKNMALPSSHCATAELPFPHPSGRSTKPPSSYARQAFTLIHHLHTDLPYNTMLTAFNSDSVNSWPSLQQDSGFTAVLSPICRVFYLQPFRALPCLLWFQRPAVLWAPAAPRSLVPPVKTDREVITF